MGRERRVRKSINYAEPKLNTCVSDAACPCILVSDPPWPYNRKMRKPDPMTGVKRASSGGLPDDNARALPSDIPTVTERRRKSRPRLPVDEDEESDGAQADEEPLAGSRVRLGLGNVDTRRRSAVVTASRRSLIEDDEGRRHSMLV
jgi:hypothetical protein